MAAEMVQRLSYFQKTVRDDFPALLQLWFYCVDISVFFQFSELNLPCLSPP